MLRVPVGGRPLGLQRRRLQRPGLARRRRPLSTSQTERGKWQPEVLEPWEGEIPTPVPITDLPAPKMELSLLEGNRLRVASQETYGHLCNFGIFLDAGSRVETSQITGTTQLMELMAFKSTYKRSQEQMHLDIGEMGGTTVAYSARDLIMYNVEVLREYLDPAMELLAESILQPSEFFLNRDSCLSDGEMRKVPWQGILSRVGRDGMPGSVGYHIHYALSHMCCLIL